MKAFFFLAALLVAGVVVSVAGDCFDGQAPTSASSQCCWYGDDACCSEDTQAGLGAVFQQLFQDGQFNETQYNNCYYFVVDTLCMFCAPNNDAFIAPGDPASDWPYTTTVCNGWCNQAFEYCEGFFENAGFGPFANGTDLCNGITAMNGNFTVAPEGDTNCFNPKPLSDVTASPCTLVYPTPDNGNQPAPSPGGFTWWEWTLIIGLPIVALIIVAVAAAAGFMYWKRRQTYEAI